MDVPTWDLPPSPTVFYRVLFLLGLRVLRRRFEQPALDRFGTESKSWRRPIECILFRSKDEEFSSFFFADRQQTLVWPAAAVRRGKGRR